MNAPVANVGSWALLLAAGCGSCLGNLLLKRSKAEAPSGLLDLLLNPWLIAGLAAHGANAFLFAKALEKLPVSVAYPALAGCGFLLLVVSAKFFFGERLGASQWMGVGLIMGGIYLSAR
jgi:multidrug transporter EmrE-like cation transporter